MPSSRQLDAVVGSAGMDTVGQLRVVVRFVTGDEQRAELGRLDAGFRWRSASKVVARSASDCTTESSARTSTPAPAVSESCGDR
jgi:hypothetical protein